jgi:hypothetical protein
MTDIAPGATFGAWEILSVNGRAALCRCVCGVNRAIAIDALVIGTAAPSCGCAALTADQRGALRGETEERKRRRDIKNWRPQA